MFDMSSKRSFGPWSGKPWQDFHSLRLPVLRPRPETRMSGRSSTVGRMNFQRNSHIHGTRLHPYSALAVMCICRSSRARRWIWLFISLKIHVSHCTAPSAHSSLWPRSQYGQTYGRSVMAILERHEHKLVGCSEEHILVCLHAPLPPNYAEGSLEKRLDRLMQACGGFSKI